MSEGQKEHNKQSLSACQMIKNVVKTHMEMRKKRQDELIGKIVKKIVKKNRLSKMKRLLRKVLHQSVVMDLNVNIRFKK